MYLFILLCEHCCDCHKCQMIGFENAIMSFTNTQIKTKLIGTKKMRAHHVKVVTEDRVVYLMGLTTPEEEMTATDIAQTVPGVEKVVQIFEGTTP